jgi:hypothetical protein
MYQLIKIDPYPPLAAKKQLIPKLYFRIKIRMIKITPDKIIGEVQKEFSEEFPFLKIEFFKKSHRYRQSSQRDQGLPTEWKVGNPAIFNSGTTFNITPSMTVKELVKRCEEEFGLYVQVYRKARKLWLETTMTENWTLKQQNDSGREISQ